VQVARGVVAHRLEVEVLEDIERLQHHRALHPGVELVDLDTAVGGAAGRLDLDLPAREVLAGDEPARGLHRPGELGGDVAAVEAFVGGHDGLLACGAALEGALLGLDQLAQRRRELGLAEDLTGARRLATGGGGIAATRGGERTGLERMRQHDARAVRPFLDLGLVALDGVRGLRLDGVAVGERDGGCEHFRQRELAVLGEHHEDAARCAGRDRRKRAVLGRIGHTAAAEELHRGAGRRDAEGVDRDHALLDGMPDERLGLAAPVQRVPHRRRGRDHGAGRVHCVAAAFEHLGAGGRTQRLAGDRHPMLAVQGRLFGALLCGHRARGEQGGKARQRRPQRCPQRRPQRRPRRIRIR
jgi:hypothetical protein